MSPFAFQEAKRRLERELGLVPGVNGFGHKDESWAMLWLAYSNLLLVEKMSKELS